MNKIFIDSYYHSNNISKTKYYLCLFVQIQVFIVIISIQLTWVIFEKKYYWIYF